MRTFTTLDVKLALRVREVGAIVQRRYGGEKGLKAHIDRHPDDNAAIALYTALDWHRDEPDAVVELTEHLRGDPLHLLGAAKLDLIGQLMGQPGISVRQLARSLGKNPATVLQHVRDLEAAGLVVRDQQGQGKPARLRPTVQEIVIRVSAKP